MNTFYLVSYHILVIEYLIVQDPTFIVRPRPLFYRNTTTTVRDNGLIARALNRLC